LELTLLDCGTMRPRAAGLLFPQMARVPCNCLLLRWEGGLVLVDTGLGTRDVHDPWRLGPANLLLRACPDPERPALRQLERMGYRPGEVGDIVCTHLDRDHAGGLPDFPGARVHLSAAERDAALRPRGAGERERYRACQLAHGPDWVAYDTWDEECRGLPCTRLSGLPECVLLVSLPGHTRGHCGVAVDTGKGWLLHCGDAFYLRDELEQPAALSPALRIFRRLAHVDRAAAAVTLSCLKKAASGQGDEAVTLVASHDPEAALPPAVS